MRTASTHLSTADGSLCAAAPARYTRGMPPAPSAKPDTSIDVSHMLPEHTVTKRRGGAGPLVSAVIIVSLLIFGGLYFWGAELNERESEQLPFIPADSTTS